MTTKPNLTIRDVYSVLSGKCKLFEISGKMAASEFLTFYANFSNRPISLFVLNKGEELGIISGVAKFQQKPVAFSGQAVLYLLHSYFPVLAQGILGKGAFVAPLEDCLTGSSIQAGTGSADLVHPIITILINKNQAFVTART